MSRVGIFAYIYHKKSTIHVGNYTNRPMDPMGCVFGFFSHTKPQVV